MEALLTGARIQELRLESLSNNLANINTPGFKENKIFSLEKIQIAGPNNSAITTSAYLPSESTLTLPAATYIDFKQGSMVQTANPLDIALEGEGFFTVKTPEGDQYTRNGSFSINQDNVLVTKEGYPVLGDGGEITIDAENGSTQEISIDETGSIFQGETEVGSFRIETFEDTSQLEKVGETFFANRGAAGSTPDEGAVVVRQGYLEQSNVEAIRAMTEMIEVLRGFEIYQKALKTVDQIDAKAINDVGAVS